MRQHPKKCDLGTRRVKSTDATINLATIQFDYERYVRAHISGSKSLTPTVPNFKTLTGI